MTSFFSVLFLLFFPFLFIFFSNSMAHEQLSNSNSFNTSMFNNNNNNGKNTSNNVVGSSSGGMATIWPEDQSQQKIQQNTSSSDDNSSSNKPTHPEWGVMKEQDFHPLTLKHQVDLENSHQSGTLISDFYFWQANLGGYCMANMIQSKVLLCCCL